MRTLRRCQTPWESRKVKKHWHSILKLLGCRSYYVPPRHHLAALGKPLHVIQSLFLPPIHLKRTLRNVSNTATSFISAYVSLKGTVWQLPCCSTPKEEAPAHTPCLFSLLSRHFPPHLATFAIPLTTLQLGSVEPIWVIFLFHTYLYQVISTFKYAGMHSNNCLQTYIHI